MKKYKTIIWLAAITVLLSNWPLIQNITGLNDWYYRYSNISGTFTMMENSIQGRLFKKPPNGEFILNRPNFYGCNLMPQSDTVVYRLFAINPLKFWRWGEYIFDWRYRLPYTDWDAIVKKRGFGYLKVSQKGCMEF
ncbi:hypothetical protein ACFOWM_10325 [Ferruginibacter yonginensis]|uniref:Uncharacterized protein n=1 Tax=Ferruginibacter yonginensis TaxID=1310416 RepID=A0ABV8QUF7_9BACT